MDALPRILSRREGPVGQEEAATNGIRQVYGCGDVRQSHDSGYIAVIISLTYIPGLQYVVDFLPHFVLDSDGRHR